MTKIYTVQSGETLPKIATKLLGDVNRWQEIAYINSLTHPYFIRPGQILEIPDDKGELIINVIGKKPTAAASTVKPGFNISPATTLLVLAIGAALFWPKRS